MCKTLVNGKREAWQDGKLLTEFKCQSCGEWVEESQVVWLEVESWVLERKVMLAECVSCS